MIPRPPISTPTDTLFPYTTRVRSVRVVGHVGDLARWRREARRQHQLVAAGQEAVVGAVLVHDGQTLDAPVLRPLLGDVHDLRIEIALLAGEPLVDLVGDAVGDRAPVGRSEEHTSELQSLMRISYAVFCLKKKKK